MSSMGGKVVKFPDPGARLRHEVRQHLKQLGFKKGKNGLLSPPGHDKETVRQLHREQRRDKFETNAHFLAQHEQALLPYFANGDELEPSKIQLSLRRVRGGTLEADLFRFATLTWSVPVSAGFGRRIRYVVWDDTHDKLAGVIALGDPVFNLSVRDNLIGWNTKDRSARLVHLLDAYVLGAVPPYSLLLGGKAVAALIRTRDVVRDFDETYGDTVGIISGKAKHASLLMVTTTSSMGRSSVYNRLTLGGDQYFRPIGYTTGWGHFHITDALFDSLRDYLRKQNHRYADHHEYGKGPNWRLRTIKAALASLGFNDSLLKHGIQRQVFVCMLATNASEILRGQAVSPNYDGVLSASEVSELAVNRWMAPRGTRDPRYRSWRREWISNLIRGSSVGYAPDSKGQAGTARRED